MESGNFFVNGRVGKRGARRDVQTLGELGDRFPNSEGRFAQVNLFVLSFRCVSRPSGEAQVTPPVACGISAPALFSAPEAGAGYQTYSTPSTTSRATMGCLNKGRCQQRLGLGRWEVIVKDQKTIEVPVAGRPPAHVEHALRPRAQRCLRQWTA